jgi:hypothetical protein
VAVCPDRAIHQLLLRQTLFGVAAVVQKGTRFKVSLCMAATVGLQIQMVLLPGAVVVVILRQTAMALLGAQAVSSSPYGKE